MQYHASMLSDYKIHQAVLHLTNNICTSVVLSVNGKKTNQSLVPSKSSTKYFLDSQEGAQLKELIQYIHRRFINQIFTMKDSNIADHIRHSVTVTGDKRHYTNERCKLPLLINIYLLFTQTELQFLSLVTMKPFEIIHN